jgi:hypothetical protein
LLELLGRLRQLEFTVDAILVSRDELLPRVLDELCFQSLFIYVDWL